MTLNKGGKLFVIHSNYSTHSHQKVIGAYIPKLSQGHKCPKVWRPNLCKKTHEILESLETKHV